MESIGSKLVQSGLEEATESAHGLLSRLLGPAADEVGLLLADKIRPYRVRNAVKTLAKTEDMLEAAGVNANPIPLRLLFPIIEGMSLEDDETLQEAWAALIANASSGNTAEVVHPSYPHILSQLTPLDAQVLLEFPNDKSVGQSIEGFRAAVVEKFGLSLEVYDRIGSHLLFLGLVRYPPTLSPVGRHFMQACTPPPAIMHIT